MAGLGFDSLSLGDHHLTNDHYVQVMPAISRMAGISGDMQLLPLFLLPFYKPGAAGRADGNTGCNYRRTHRDDLRVGI